jgi:hypothetical protein
MSIFSERQGLSVPDAEITIRDSAPDELREVLPTLCYQVGLRPSDLREWLCELLLQAPDRNNWSDPNIDSEVRNLLLDCEWFEVYDAIEVIGRQLQRRIHNGTLAAGPFEQQINRYFRRAGIGWQLVNGTLEMRGPETFEKAIRQGRDVLLTAGKHTAANELHEAILDLSRRPNAEITGAIQHAMAALECVARDKCFTKDTLGDLLRRNPGLFPRPLDDLVQKAWGWSSNSGRHLVEGAPPAFEDAELVVGLSGVLCRFLGRKL